MNPSSAAASPSPIFPLVILGLVLFMAAGPWMMSTEPMVEEVVVRGRSGRIPVEALILIPAVMLIFFQFYGSYEQPFRWRMPNFTIPDSFLTVAGFVVVLMVLMWMRSAVREMVQAL